MKKQIKVFLFLGLSLSIISCSKEDDFEGAETGDEFYEEIVPEPAKEYYDDLNIWTYNTAFLEADYQTLSTGLYGIDEPCFDSPEWFYNLTGEKFFNIQTNRVRLLYKETTIRSERNCTIDFTVPRENVRIAAVKIELYNNVDCNEIISIAADQRFEEAITSWSDENLCDFEIKDGKTINIYINNPDVYALYYFYLEADPTEEEWNQGYRKSRCMFFIEQSCNPFIGDASITPGGTWEGC